MAKIAKFEISDDDRERMAVTLEELAAALRNQPDRIKEATLSWEKEHPHVWIDEDTYRNAPQTYSFSLTLWPLQEIEVEFRELGEGNS